jgi:4-coumarate--CoA ligase
MPWLSQESYPLPEEDLVTFAFGNTDYDEDKPVQYLSSNGQRIADDL